MGLFGTVLRKILSYGGKKRKAWYLRSCFGVVLLAFRPHSMISPHIWSASSCMHMIAILLDHTSDHAGRWSIYPLLIISAPLILNLANQSLMYRHAVFSHNKMPTLLLMHNIFYYNNKINKTERDIMMIKLNDKRIGNWDMIYSAAVYELCELLSKEKARTREG